MDKQTEKLYAIWLLTVCGPGSFNSYKMLKTFKSAEEMYRSSGEDYYRSGLFKTREMTVCADDKSLDKAKRIIEDCEKEKVDIITYFDDDYPEMFKYINCPPIALFIKGTLPDTYNNPSISIVGTRNSTQYGQKTAAKISRELAQCNFIIASGMAEGIDTYVHKGALYEQKPTVAFLASGVDVVYPHENKLLYDKIQQNGAVVSEYFLQTRPHTFNFNPRNRLITAFTHGLLVVESADNGGSLLYVKHALDQDKMVFAVPGPTNSPSSKGTNGLIKAGAIICTAIEDIINEYEGEIGNKIDRKALQKLIDKGKQNKPVKEKKNYKITDSVTYEYQTKTEHNTSNLSEKQLNVYNIIDKEPVSIDTLTQILQISFPETLMITQSLEISGYIQSIAGGMYIRKKN